MAFVGIDLAADPKRTGLAIVSGVSRCVVEHVYVGADADGLVEAIRTADHVGVDV